MQIIPAVAAAVGQHNINLLRSAHEPVRTRPLVACGRREGQCGEMRSVALKVRSTCSGTGFPQQTSLSEHHRRDVNRKTGQTRVCHLNRELLTHCHRNIVEIACGIGGDDIACGARLVIQRIGVGRVSVDRLRRHNSCRGSGIAQQSGGHVKVKIGE